MLFSLVSPILVLIFSVLGSACLRLPRQPMRVAAIYVFAYSHLIITAYTVAVVYRLGDTWAWLLMQGGLTLMMALIWWYRGKPAWQLQLPSLARPTLQDILPTLLLMATVGAYLVLLWLVIIMPPTNYDGLLYRLPRIMLWLQFDTLIPVEGVNMRVSSYPYNQEIGLLWLILVRGSDQVVGLLHWSTALMTALVLYDLTRFIGGTWRQSIIVVCIWASLPMIMLQASTVQSDLLQTCMLLISLYGLYIGVDAGRRGPLLLSALALGIALGIKPTVLFFLPGLALIAFILWLYQPRRRFALLFQWALACIFAFLVLSAHMYGVNLRAYGHVLGAAANDPTIEATELRRGALFVQNMSIYTYQFIDFGGLPSRLAVPLTDLKQDIVQQVIAPLHLSDASVFATDLNRYTTANPRESTSWFGVLGWLVWLPGLCYGGWRAYHRRDPYLGGFVLIAVLFFLTHALILQPSPWRGRYHVVMITIGAPLMLWLFHTEARWLQLMRWVVGVLVVINLSVVLLTNQRKPLIGPDAVQNKDRLDLVADATFHARTFIHEFEATVPADALVRLHIDPLPDSDLLPYVVLYPYWGPTLDRTLLPVSGTYTSLAELATAPVRLTFGTSSHLDYPAADYLLIQEGVRATITDFSGFEEVGNNAAYRRGAITLYLYRRVETVAQ